MFLKETQVHRFDLQEINHNPQERVANCYVVYVIKINPNTKEHKLNRTQAGFGGGIITFIRGEIRRELGNEASCSNYAVKWLMRA